MFEYKRSDVKFRQYTEITMVLNAEGKDGWEVINYNEEKCDNSYTARILFKREIKST